MSAWMKSGIALAALLALAGCSSSSSDSSKKSASDDYAFIANAFYAFGVNIVDVEETDRSPYVESIEFDAAGNATMISGEEAEEGAVALGATDYATVFELTGDAITAGPAYIVVDSTEDTTRFVFVQFSESDVFLDLNTFVAGDVPAVFPPETAFDAPILVGTHTGTGFTLNADGTLNDVFEGDSATLVEIEPNILDSSIGDIFAGSTLADTGTFTLDSGALLDAQGYFFLDDPFMAGSLTFDASEGHMLAAPDGDGLVIVACVNTGTCGDGNGGAIGITDFHFSALFR